MVIHYYEQSIKTNETVSANPLRRTKIGRYTDGQTKNRNRTETGRTTVKTNKPLVRTFFL